MQSIVCLLAISCGLVVAAVVYTRLLVCSGRLQAAVLRHGVTFAIYTAFSVCLIGALIAVVRLDLFGLDAADEPVHVVAEITLFAIAAGPALLLVRRSAGSG